jgi:diacylglycerol kinase
MVSQKAIIGSLPGAKFQLLINIFIMFKSADRFVKSFGNAARGIGYLFKSQPNARIELSIAILVIIAGFLFRIQSFEWIIIFLCIALVLGLEGINTAIETLLNKVHPNFNIDIGKAKDAAAGAVLIASFVAAIIGFIIFAPRILILFGI